MALAEISGSRFYGVKRFSVFDVPFDPRQGINGKVVRFDGREFKRRERGK